MTHPTILAIANQKGGVGKTTTTVNLATAFAACGQRVLVIDLDPQANTTTSFGIQVSELKTTVYDVLLDALPIQEAIVQSGIPNLDLLPAHSDLAGAQIELSGLEDGRERLKQALDKCAQHYDYILLDCQPSLALLPLNALFAASAVLIPVQSEYLAMEGLASIYKFIQNVSQVRGSQLDLHGILITMTDNTNLSNQVEIDVRKVFGKNVFVTTIPRNVRIAEAPSYGKPVIRYDPQSRGAQAYFALAAEILQRDGKVLDQ